MNNFSLNNWPVYGKKFLMSVFGFAKLRRNIEPQNFLYELCPVKICFIEVIKSTIKISILIAVVS